MPYSNKDRHTHDQREREREREIRQVHKVSEFHDTTPKEAMSRSFVT